MRLGLALIAMISAACGIDTAEPIAGDPGGGGGGDSAGDPTSGDPGTGSGPVTEVSGHITASATWSDTVHVTGALTIDPGVTVTVAPGATIDVASGANVPITVQGTLAIQGTKASKVVVRTAISGEFWYGFAVPSGGQLTASYLVEIGGGLVISGTGRVTLVDSQLSHAPRDLLTMVGGTLDMTYSAIGVEPGQKDTTHCDMHVSGAVTITATHSNFSTAAYGLMLYSASLADFRYTNWFGNTIDIAVSPPVAADLSNSYFAKGAPSLAGLKLDNPAGGRIADAGVR